MRTSQDSCACTAPTHPPIHASPLLFSRPTALTFHAPRLRTPCPNAAPPATQPVIPAAAQPVEWLWQQALCLLRIPFVMFYPHCCWGRRSGRSRTIAAPPSARPPIGARRLSPFAEYPPLPPRAAASPAAAPSPRAAQPCAPKRHCLCCYLALLCCAACEGSASPGRRAPRLGRPQLRLPARPPRSARRHFCTGRPAQHRSCVCLLCCCCFGTPARTPAICFRPFPPTPPLTGTWCLAIVSLRRRRASACLVPRRGLSLPTPPRLPWTFGWPPIFPVSALSPSTLPPHPRVLIVFPSPLQPQPANECRVFIAETHDAPPYTMWRRLCGAPPVMFNLRNSLEQGAQNAFSR